MADEWIVERLATADIARNVALSQSVGWPDTESEWRVLHEAALVLGVRHDGELVGQGALGLLDGAAAIAKMVVAPELRQHGIGGSILDALLAEAARRGLSVQGLVATPLGQALYRKRGFEPIGEVVISIGSARSELAGQLLPKIDDPEQIVAIERRFMTGSRATMLRARLREASASALSQDGFALATASGTGSRLGPIIADSLASAQLLTSTLLQALSGMVRLDVPGEQCGFRAWLRELGFVEQGVHVEMSRGGALPWNVAQRFGLATQAWG